ncbi:unnamed protein product, partial [Phytomonas sp. Hart1]
MRPVEKCNNGPRGAPAFVSPVTSITPKPRKGSTSIGDLQVPYKEDHHALLLDFILYRRETLLPVLRGFKKERCLLEKRLVDLDRKVKELCEVRESIRTMILEHEDIQQKNLLRVLETSQGAVPRTPSQVQEEEMSDIETIEF